MYEFFRMKARLWEHLILLQALAGATIDHFLRRRAFVAPGYPGLPTIAGKPCDISRRPAGDVSAGTIEFSPHKAR